jgi:hypothetical protein
VGKEKGEKRANLTGYVGKACFWEFVYGQGRISLLHVAG